MSGAPKATASSTSKSKVHPSRSGGDNRSIIINQNVTDPAVSSEYLYDNTQVWWGDREKALASQSGEIRISDPRLSDVEYTVGRGQWGHKMEFILSCVGLSVGLGNIWRFPYLAYDNGGAAFVLAYLILQLLVGKPMYFMELSMGQFSGKGPSRVWDMVPACKGIGFASCMASLVAGIYYNAIMAYTLYYFFVSFQSKLPWTECRDDWVKDYNCVVEKKEPPPLCSTDISTMKLLGACKCTGNATIDGMLPYSCTHVKNAMSAAEVYFYKVVLQRSDSITIEDMGAPLWHLALLLFLSWSIIMICLIKGIKSSGKVVYFTATFPYVILIILLIRVSLLDGAGMGASYFLFPKWEKLLEIKVWVAAAGQMFFSLGLCFGGILVFGSYNRFQNQVYNDALIIACLDILTSLIGGLVVFMTFGAMAKNIGTTVDKVANSGYGLAFVVYPEALSNMEPSQLWSILFFFMLFTLGLDTEFAFMEAILTCVQDEFPNLRRYKSHLCVALVSCCFVLGLPCVCPGGDYVVTIMDMYGADFCLLLMGGFESVAVGWIYGVRRFMMDMEYMLGQKPHGWRYWMFCWGFTCPVIIFALFFYRIFNYSPPKYPDGSDYPDLAQNFGIVLSTLVLSPIILWFVYLVGKVFLYMPQLGTTQEKMKYLFGPTRRWKPNDGRSLAPTRQASMVLQK